jgi:hypothetical protein
MIVACVALAVALGGVSYAASQLPANSVGTPQLKANAVNSSKVLNGSLLKADFKPGQAPVGPTGPTGPTGAKGDPGPPATGLRAVVHGDGSIDPESTSGVTASLKTGTGTYRVQFSQSVASCAILVTPALGSRTVAAANQAQSASLAATDVDVTEVDMTSGQGIDGGFSIAAVC